MRIINSEYLLLIIIILQPFPPAKAIFASIAILLAVCPLFRFKSANFRDISVSQTVKDISDSYDTLVVIFESFEHFLSRLSIYIGVPSTAALSSILVKIMVELLSTLALATKEAKQGRLSE